MIISCIENIKQFICSRNITDPIIISISFILAAFFLPITKTTSTTIICKAINIMSYVARGDSKLPSLIIFVFILAVRIKSCWKIILSEVQSLHCLYSSVIFFISIYKELIKKLLVFKLKMETNSVFEVDFNSLVTILLYF